MGYSFISDAAALSKRNSQSGCLWSRDAGKSVETFPLSISFTALALCAPFATRIIRLEFIII